jgi:hypothetical protein
VAARGGGLSVRLNEDGNGGRVDKRDRRQVNANPIIRRDNRLVERAPERTMLSRGDGSCPIHEETVVCHRVDRASWENVPTVLLSVGHRASRAISSS